MTTSRSGTTAATGAPAVARTPVPAAQATAHTPGGAR